MICGDSLIVVYNLELDAYFIATDLAVSYEEITIGLFMTVGTDALLLYENFIRNFPELTEPKSFVFNLELY